MLSATRIWAVMAKEFIQLTRDHLAYAMILIMPILLLAQGLSNALRNWLFLSGMEEALPTSQGDVGHA